MNNKTQREKIDIAVNEWIRYIEIFGCSKMNTQYLRSKNYSWDDIINIYKKAIKNNEEIDL